MKPLSRTRELLRGVLSRNGRLRRTFREAKGATKALLLVGRFRLKRLSVSAAALLSGRPDRVAATDFSRFPIVVINLERRKDRLALVAAEFQKLGFTNVRRFTAIETRNGLVGCARSHLEVLEGFLSSKAPALMVCEDDISFTASGDCLAQTVQDFLADSVMDVLCIGNNPQRTPIAWSDTLSLTSDTQTTSCYVVKRSAAKALTRNLQRGLSRLKRTGNASRYALDVYWKKLQGGRLIFCLPTERLAAQRPSFSDIQDVWVDYGV